MLLILGTQPQCPPLIALTSILFTMQYYTYIGNASCVINLHAPEKRAPYNSSITHTSLALGWPELGLAWLGLAWLG